MAREELRNALVAEYQATDIEIEDIKQQIAELNRSLQELAPKLQITLQMLKRYGWADDVLSEETEPLQGLLDEPQNKGVRIAAEAKDLLSANSNEWQKLSSIYEHIASSGILIGGKNPTSTLSAHLSNSGLFESDRSKGWRLKNYNALIRKRK